MTNSPGQVRSPNIYLPFFGPPPDESQRTRAVDWSHLKVDVPYFFFITGRCGSTWLAHLLEDSGICGGPHEFFNEGLLSVKLRPAIPTTLSQYLESTILQHRAGRRFGMQIDGWRFSHLQHYLDFDSVFPGFQRVVFWMTREDLVAQAHSFFIAKSTGRWHVYRGASQPTSAADSVAVDDKSMWDEIFFILVQEQQMEKWFATRSIKPYRLTYEHLATNKYMVLMRVMSLLGCDSDAIGAYLEVVQDRTMPILYDDRYSYLNGFISRFSRLLERVYEQRIQLDLNDLRRDVAMALKQNNLAEVIRRDAPA